MEKLSSREKALALLDALERYGQGDYIGESISQLEHCLQAAHNASKANARDELVIAALLHDIGQIVPLESTREARMELGPSQANVGRVGHEAIGASYLHSLGFSETVSRLVNSHVAAKRYLTAKSREYYTSLSTASQKSLGFQGGPFQGDDLKAFEADPLRDDMVSLRLWDDASKVEGIEAIIPRALAYLDMITGHLDREFQP
ncbi:Phytanoyl-CoA dioxygenase [Penicillium brevicompactum]|uniref:Phytanoyl-CoA dioxygenase n=1 Tax=Penicillium brevicompactum TaxID=5074 RepID=A0A9W9UKT0_PENBR|nr:Phytanoyl-CoA dioxygenase [Penicillium brevicompactum]